MCPQRHPELGRERAQAPSQRCPVDERSRRRLRDRDGGRVGIDDEIGVLRLLAEAPVEPVRELRRAHRAEPVGDVDVRGATEADVAQKPLAGACVDRDVERRVEEWPGPEGAARHPLHAAGADQPDRAHHASLRCGQRCGRGLVARHPTDVDSADRRPGRDRLALGQRHAAQSRSHDRRR